MNIKNTNISQLIADTQKQLAKEKLSPAFKILIKLLLLIIRDHFGNKTKNSRNSSIPPSQDPNRIKKKKSSTKKPGGQLGHKGVTLERVSRPDEVIPLPLDRRTLPKNHSYTNAEPEKRQVMDIETKIVVKEYQAEVLIDENGKKFVAKFPAHVTKAIQYGSWVKSNAVFMNCYQMCSLKRIEDNFVDQLHIQLSKGTVYNASLEAYHSLEKFEHWLKTVLPIQKVLNADETGVNVNGKRIWLHTLCNHKYTLFHVNDKRGKSAMDEMGILPIFKGYLCHDHWKAYFKYFCKHLLCNAHHLRELTYIEEVELQNWAKKMREFLVKINLEVKNKGGKLSPSRQKKVVAEYRKILNNGEKENKMPKKIRGKRGRVKKTKSRNLLERFQNFEIEILAFMTDKDLPFTNNQGENDLRMTKVQQKVSGCFRSMEGANIFARIRSYINTCKKNKINITEALIALFEGNLDLIIEKIEKYAD